MNDIHMNDDNIKNFLSVVKLLGHDTWMEYESNILVNPNTPPEMKEDFANVLDIVNMIFEDQDISLIVEHFKGLPSDQQSLLQMFVDLYYMNDHDDGEGVDDDCDCPNCTLAKDINKDNRDRYLRQKEISDNRIYPISETIFNEMNREISICKSLIARLRMTITLLPEDDERFLYAMELLNEEVW